MKKFNITNFKCFTKAEIELNNLTILAGANGNGKSTVIQALLFLRQTIENIGVLKDKQYIIDSNNDYINLDSNIPLNGNYCLALGNCSHVLNRNFEEGIINLTFSNDIDLINIAYQVDLINPQLFLYAYRQFNQGNFGNLSIFLKEFYYLNAERNGPRIQQSLRHSEFPNAGWQGENTVQLINLENGMFKITPERYFKDKKTPYISEQLNFWLNDIMPGIKVKVVSDYKNLSGQILIENPFTENEPTLATNLGFGVSYILPIIATGLIAKENSIFIVENPEAHLHPSAQSKIGRFLGKIANSGVNIIVETHSDHVISGIQIAVAEKEIPAEKVTINFFNQVSGNKQPEVKPIRISANGELSEWPKGFFDQTQIDYAHLFKLRRK